MSTSTNPIGSSSSLSSLQTDTFDQEKQAFTQLAKSLKSGDLSGAQKAYSTLQSLVGNQNGNSTIQQDFLALGKALNSGNLSDAQSAFSSLGKDLKAAASQTTTGSVQGRHHGHHHRSTTDDSSTSTSTTTSQSNLPATSTFSVYA